MLTSKKMAHRLFIVAGLSVMAASAGAFVIDPKIVIDRALDSPTLTVRYTGVSAALVELRVNGESLGTRSVAATKASGETDFTLDLSDLREGDNDVEVRLFDPSGKLVGHERTNIQTEAVAHGPVILSEPKLGATVQGPVEIKVSLDTSLKDSYVSFFIDGNFKSMTNFPPYNFVWDTEKETNGWHVLEAWAIDGTSETHKTHKIRVFVNNPQGHTQRLGADAITPDTVRVSNQAPVAITVTHSRLTTVGNGLDLTAGPSVDLKPVAVGPAIATGMQHLRPTGKRLAAGADPLKPVAMTKGVPVIVVTPSDPLIAMDTVQTPRATELLPQVSSAASLVTLTRGSRLPNLGFFEIALDTHFVDFHGVDPRVDDGVPMTPLRFLLEQAGGKVGWENQVKQVDATTPGRDISVKIGDPDATVNKAKVSLERPAYIDRGRTIVPLSFIRSTLDVNVQYDKKTGHVLITSAKK